MYTFENIWSYAKISTFTFVDNSREIPTSKSRRTRARKAETCASFNTCNFSVLVSSKEIHVTTYDFSCLHTSVTGSYKDFTPISFLVFSFAFNHSLWSSTHLTCGRFTSLLSSRLKEVLKSFHKNVHHAQLLLSIFSVLLPRSLSKPLFSQ